jgi:thymidylate synthase (FAD)
MAHCVVEEAEKILDVEFPVLNKGFIRLVDYMGSDDRIVQAARVSYGKGTKSVREDKGLITYLLRNDHTSPFEQVVFTFHCKMPLFVARQWIRHRTARLNEISGRYSVMADDFYIPEPADISFQSTDNKQGRSEVEVPEELKLKIVELFKEDQKRVYENYESLLEKDIARELARINLPLSLYTEWYWQIDLHNLFHFLRLRLDGHAQKEIRVYAEAMYEAASKVCPLAFEAFDQYIVGSVRFSSDEITALHKMLKGEDHGLKGRDKTLFEKKLSDGRQL